MVQLSIQTIGEQKFVRGMDRYVSLVKDFRPVFGEIGEWFFEDAEDNFRAGGKPEPFAELSPAYKRWKAKHYPGKPILRLRDRLYDSLTGANQAGSGDTVRKVQRKRAEFGTRVPYANRQFKAGRKAVQFTEPKKREVVKMIQKWAFELMKDVLR